MGVVFDAITLGCLYSLLGVGLALVYGVVGIPHFAQAGVIASAALLATYLQVSLHWPFGLVIPTTVLLAGVLSVAIERLAYWPVVRANRGAVAGPAVALGVLLVLASLNLLVWGSQRQIIETPYAGSSVELFGQSIAGPRVAVVVWAVVSVALLQIYLKGTRTGRSIVAASQDATAAKLVGVSRTTTYVVAFFIAGCFGGVASVAYGSQAAAYPNMADTIILNAFVVIIIGGLGSILGSIAGGFLLGLVEVLGVTFISSQYQQIYGFLLLVAVLLVRPNGLFGRSTRAA